jgi:hypothetical protein
MAGDGDQVFGLEVVGLMEDASANLGQREAMLGAGVVEESASLLHGLEGDASDTGLLQGEVDDGAELVIVDAAFYGDYQCRRDVEFVQAHKGTFADVAQVGSAQLHEGLAAKRVELEV